MKILVLHGPNLNLLGRREPHIYGSDDARRAQQEARRGWRRSCASSWSSLQSNHEGELVDMLHKHIDTAAGAILNPAGLTQFGVSLHDAIKTMPFPVIEVHISNRHAREEWRHHSIISSAVKATVEGLGWRSYTAALRALVEIVRETKK